MSIEDTLNAHHDQVGEIIDMVDAMNFYGDAAVGSVFAMATCCKEVIRLTHEYVGALTSSSEDGEIREVIREDLTNLDQLLDSLGIVDALLQQMIEGEELSWPDREEAVKRFR